MKRNVLWSPTERLTAQSWQLKSPQTHYPNTNESSCP